MGFKCVLPLETRWSPVQSNKGVSDSTEGQECDKWACMDPGFCPCREKPSQFSSGFSFTCCKGTVNLCICIIGLTEDEFKQFYIVKYDCLEKPLRDWCLYSALEHKTDSHHIRIATFHSEIWLCAPERRVHSVGSIIAIPQYISQLASLLLARRKANF